MSQLRKIGFAILAAAPFLSDYAAQGQSCRIDITKPPMGATVSGAETVSGRAELAAGQYLWVFAHRKGLALWWPEGGGAVVVTNGAWEALVTYGQPQDAGAQFEVTAVAVDLKVNNELNAWFQKAGETGNYPGLRLPNSSCIAKPVLVTRQ